MIYSNLVMIMVVEVYNLLETLCRKMIIIKERIGKTCFMTGKKRIKR